MWVTNAKPSPPIVGSVTALSARLFELAYNNMQNYCSYYASSYLIFTRPLGQGYYCEGLGVSKVNILKEKYRGDVAELEFSKWMVVKVRRGRRGCLNQNNYSLEWGTDIMLISSDH